MASSFTSKIKTRIVLPTSFSPLKDKNFALFWTGAFLSSIGFWIQYVGQGWQVLQLTNSALLLGLVSFAAMMPNIVLSLFGGVIADRFNRRILLIITQVVYMCTAAILGVLTTLHMISVWHIIVMALINGTFSTVGFPAWQAFIGELVEEQQLKQGIALNSMQFNLSRVVGPAIGGLSVGIFGIAGSYYLNALSYVAVIVPLLLLHVRRQAKKQTAQKILRDVSEGLRYVRKRPSLQLILALQFIIAFLVFPYATLLPIFADSIFHIGATGLGVLNAAAGIGAMVGSIIVVLLSQRLERNTGTSILIGLCVFGGLASVAFAISRNLDPSLLLLIIMGASTVMSSTITNTALQTMTPEHMRGRVLSIWVLLALGLAPFGNLAAGWVAQWLGAPATLLVSGGLCALCAALIALVERSRRHRIEVVDVTPPAQPVTAESEIVQEAQV